MNRNKKEVGIAVVYGSPRRKGNTAVLADAAAKGCENAGAIVEKIVLRDYKFSPCLEIYGCKNNGECVIKDDFQVIKDKLLESEGLILASPIFFYAVSSHTKMLMERCQSLWVKKYWLDEIKPDKGRLTKKGLFISVGATKGKKLFKGALLSVKYFFDVLDMELWKSLLYSGLDFEGDVMKHPEYIEEARRAGEELVKEIKENDVRNF